MDTNVDDKIYHQVQKSLSNNINEDLFSKQPFASSSIFDTPRSLVNTGNLEREATNETHEYENQSPTLSRAEYIRQAREACLRQMSASQNYSRTMDAFDFESEPQSVDLLHKKKSKVMNLFHDGNKTSGTIWGDNAANEENSPQEIASFRNLIIRTVCALVIFLTIFAIDKFETKIGGFSYLMVREYITGNDRLQQLENIIVTWLK